ncbi:hypothetical protein LJR066_004453 [Acidovorax sp. LjRoot66]|uniref:hypothetical protein n=1 Tax=Acidovorax sp. LjRoot66 TaxID=3342334 RepID=UPI003ECFA6B9
MSTLTGEQAHLLLRRGDDLESLYVDLVASTDDAVAKWDWTTRSSPIFPFEKYVYPEWTKLPDVYLFFLGPLDPAVWQIDVPFYATLGTYNIIAVCSSDSQVEAIHELINGADSLNWECWHLQTGKIARQVFGNPKVQSARNAVRRAKVSQGLKSAEEENCTLFAASIAKASHYYPMVADDLQLFMSAFHAKMEEADGEGDNTKLSWLVNVNAALSRFTSQAFSGVSPISATECHFWSNSLLGIGLATQALVNIRRFTEIAVGDVDWIDLLDELDEEKLPKSWVSLFRRSVNRPGDWLDAELLMKETLVKREAKALKQESSKKERLPLIVCFSGRDGFRSTNFSLSAPLEVISACNAYGWTPMTLSHEIAHVWINGVLSVIFPHPSDTVGMARMSEIAEGKNISTVLDDLKLAFYFTYSLLDREHSGTPADAALSEKTWDELAGSHGREVNEMLTHILDYQFFYRQDEVRYIKSIWSSWDVIPNIKERIQSYLIRSACAMLSEKINHENGIEATINRLTDLLIELRGDMDHAVYLDDAIGMIKKNRASIIEMIKSRALLVRIAKTFFANRTINARLEKEYPETGGAYRQLQSLKFDYQQIWNPMRFMGQYCTDRRGDRSKSLWLLTKIAFMQDPNETFESTTA